MAEPSGTALPQVQTPETFNLQVISPTEGVPGPLSFSQLPTNTTVKELKDKIKTALPTNIASHVQRLIHRGHLLARENDTMTDIFGQETLKSNDSHTLHLVLRPQDGAVTAAPTITSRVEAQTAPPPHLPAGVHGNRVGPGQPPLPPPLAHFHQLQQLNHNRQLASMQQQNEELAQQLLPSVERLQELRDQGQQIHQELLDSQRGLGPQHDALIRRIEELQAHNERLQPQLVELQQRLRSMGILPDNINNIRQASPAPGVRSVPAFPNAQPGQPPLVGQRPLPNGLPPTGMPGFQNIVGQYQRDRASMGPHGVQGMQGVHPNLVAQPGSRSGTPQPIFPSPLYTSHHHHHHPPHQHQHHPDQTRTFRQEGVGPNGERWQVTVNETTTVIPNRVQSQSPATNIQLARDVHNVIRNGDIQSRHQSRQGTPQPPATSVPVASSSMPAPVESRTVPTVLNNGTAHTPSSSRTPSEHRRGVEPNTNTVPPADSSMVYILSSPQGPRALLIQDGESFYTPRQTSQRRLDMRPSTNAIQTQLNNILNHPGVPAANVGVRNMGPVRHQRVANPVPGNPAPAAAPAPAGQNAQRPAANGLAMQLAPHIWLLIRLTGFVWFFLSGDSSWYRWIMIIGIAVVVFFANVGIFNGIAAQIWAPARRHLEALLPLAPPPRPINDPALAPRNAALPEGDAHQAPNGHARRAPEPDPAQVAARLIEQRRQQRNNSWLMQQMRRVEHAMLLFIASLVPGVGERHIMARVEQEQAVLEAERQRRAAEEERQNAEREAAATEAAAATTAIDGNTEANADVSQGSSTQVDIGAQQETAAASGVSAEDSTTLRRRRADETADGEAAENHEHNAPLVDV